MTQQKIRNPLCGKYRELINVKDPTLFGNDAAEDEDPEILNSYFVNKEDFEEFLDFDTRLNIARSRKGMGKSALLSKLAIDLAKTKENAIVIKVTRSDLVGIMEYSEGDYAVLQNYWKQTICAKINFALAETIGFAWSDNQMAIIEAAEISGFKEQNLVGSLLSRITSPRLGVSIKTKGAKNPKQLLQAHLKNNSNQEIWVLVDDIDSVFHDTDVFKDRVGSFFSACRALTRDVGGLFLRATVRADVWTSLRDNEDLDKCEQYVTDISWDNDELQEILAQRILGYLVRKHPDCLPARTWNVNHHGDDLVCQVFRERIRWAKTTVPVMQALRILSARRPRWMTQLCRMAARKIKTNTANKSLIGIGQISNIMSQYGRYRLNDVYKEHGHQFHDIKRLVTIFESGPRRYTTGEFIHRINSRYAMKKSIDKIGQIDGEHYGSNYQLARLLYRAGLVMARSGHKEDASSADFDTYESQPEYLFDKNTTPAGVIWEVYPSYRKALKIK